MKKKSKNYLVFDFIYKLIKNYNFILKLLDKWEYTKCYKYVYWFEKVLSFKRFKPIGISSFVVTTIIIISSSNIGFLICDVGLCKAGVAYPNRFPEWMLQKMEPVYKTLLYRNIKYKDMDWPLSLRPWSKFLMTKKVS